MATIAPTGVDADAQNSARRNDLVMSCWPMARVTARNFRCSRDRVIDRDDAAQEAALQLCRAARIYDPAGEASFVGLASKACYHGACRAYRQVQRNVHGPLELDVAVGPAMPNLDDQVVHAALAAIHPRYRQVVSMRYGLGTGREMTFEEVGVELGVSKQRVQQLEAQGLEKLRRVMGRVRRSERLPGA